MSDGCWLPKWLFFQILKHHLLLKWFPVICSIISPSCITTIINLVLDNSTVIEGINLVRFPNRCCSEQWLPDYWIVFPANSMLGLLQIPLRKRPGFPDIFHCGYTACLNMRLEKVHFLSSFVTKTLKCFTRKRGFKPAVGLSCSCWPDLIKGYSQMK